MKIANRAPETGIDDISNIDSDISSLANRFIKPVDRLRSTSRPSIGQVNSKSDSVDVIFKNDFNNLQTNFTTPMESRTHTFYRMLGFPVANASGGFYNPGFDPNSGKTIDKKQSVNSQIDSGLQNNLTSRELFAQNQKQIFANQDLNSSIYALLLQYTRPFKILGSDFGPLDNDPQTFKVDQRAKAIQQLAKNNPSMADSISSSGSQFVSSQHPLRPFIVDPKIENTVMPDDRKICVPFLYDKNATKIGDNIYLQRPGIETIIRNRLSDQVVSTAFYNDVTKIISGVASPSVPTATLDRQSLLDTVIALSDENNLSPTAIQNFTNFTLTQVNQVSNLVETIKAVVNQYATAVIVLAGVQQQINWFPVPSVDGPYTGPIGASLSRTNVNSSISNIDNNILELRIKTLNAQSNFNAPSIDLGSFASPFAGSGKADSVKTFNQQLQALIERRDNIAQAGFIAMGNMEIISGEVSGLGLIDILCIYTALWSIDLSSLLGFLDDDAFTRMITFNPEFLNVSEVSSRKNGSAPNIVDTLTTFETKLSGLLSWADSILAKNFKNPIGNYSGSLS